MKKKNIFFVLLICFINSSCNKEEQTDELQDKDFYSDVTTRASYISGTITGEMNPYVSDGYYTYDLSIPIQKQINRLKTLFITFEKNSSLSVSLICNAADSCHDKLNILNILDNIFENLHDTEYIPFAATPKAY